MDGKTREWLVRCAQGDYQAIVKLAAENPKLVKFKVSHLLISIAFLFCFIFFNARQHLKLFAFGAFFSESKNANF